jgi:hypothetical protein
MFGNSWKAHWWVLEGGKLVCYQDAQATVPLRTYELDEMAGISFKEKGGVMDYNSAALLFAKSDRKLQLMSSDESPNLINWIIAIDTIQTYRKLDATILHPMDKVWAMYALCNARGY